MEHRHISRGVLTTETATSEVKTTWGGLWLLLLLLLLVASSFYSLGGGGRCMILLDSGAVWPLLPAA
jgi:hypothetical protein